MTAKHDGLEQATPKLPDPGFTDPAALLGLSFMVDTLRDSAEVLLRARQSKTGVSATAVARLGQQGAQLRIGVLGLLNVSNAHLLEQLAPAPEGDDEDDLETLYVSLAQLAKAIDVIQQAPERKLNFLVQHHRNSQIWSELAKADPQIVVVPQGQLGQLAGMQMLARGTADDAGPGPGTGQYL